MQVSLGKLYTLCLLSLTITVKPILVVLQHAAKGAGNLCRRDWHGA